MRRRHKRRRRQKKERKLRVSKPKREDGRKLTKYVGAKLNPHHALPINAAPGSTWEASDGRRYELQANGSWKRIR